MGERERKGTLSESEGLQSAQNTAAKGGRGCRGYRKSLIGAPMPGEGDRSAPILIEASLEKEKVPKGILRKRVKKEGRQSSKQRGKI